MNIISQLGSKLVKLGNRILGQAMSVYTRAFTISTPEVFVGIDQNNAIEKGFNSNIQVYVCVKKDAQKFGYIPRYLFTEADKQVKAHMHPLLETKAFTPAPKNKLTELLARPNPFQGQDAFYALARASYKVTGNAYIWLNRGDIEDYRLEDGSFDDAVIDKLPVLEMYVLPPDQVSIIPDVTNLWGTLGYVLEANGRNLMRAGDVIHWRDLNLSWDAASRTHLMGMSALTPGAKTLEESNSLSRYAMRSAQNDGAKAILFNETMDAMNPTQQSELKRVIDAKINNNDVAGSVATLQGKWGMHSLAQTSKDLEMIDRKKMSWREVALLFGVPPELVDTETKYDNMGQAILQWVSNEIIPACKQLDDEMNRVLLPAFGLKGKMFIASDPSDLIEVKTIVIDFATKLQAIWSVAPDDVRDNLGYERIGGKFSEPWIITGRTPWSDYLDPEAQAAIDQASNGFGA